MEKSEFNLDKQDEQHSTSDINQLACCLKNAIFSKYIFNYLIEKVDEMWNLYEKRIDKYLQEKHLDIICHDHYPQTILQLEELINEQQENIAACKRNIEILCSSRKRLGNSDKYSVQFQSTSSNSIRVPKIPRCINRYDNKLNDYE